MFSLIPLFYDLLSLTVLYLFYQVLQSLVYALQRPQRTVFLSQSQAFCDNAFPSIKSNSFTDIRYTPRVCASPNTIFVQSFDYCFDNDNVERDCTCFKDHEQPLIINCVPRPRGIRVPDLDVSDYCYNSPRVMESPNPTIPPYYFDLLRTPLTHDPRTANNTDNSTQQNSQPNTKEETVCRPSEQQPNQRIPYKSQYQHVSSKEQQSNDHAADDQSPQQGPEVLQNVTNSEPIKLNTDEDGSTLAGTSSQQQKVSEKQKSPVSEPSTQKRRRESASITISQYFCNGKETVDSARLPVCIDRSEPHPDPQQDTNHHSSGDGFPNSYHSALKQPSPIATFAQIGFGQPQRTGFSSFSQLQQQGASNSCPALQQPPPQQAFSSLQSFVAHPQPQPPISNELNDGLQQEGDSAHQPQQDSVQYGPFHQMNPAMPPLQIGNTAHSPQTAGPSTSVSHMEISPDILAENSDDEFICLFKRSLRIADLQSCEQAYDGDQEMRSASPSSVHSEVQDFAMSDAFERTNTDILESLERDAQGVCDNCWEFISHMFSSTIQDTFNTFRSRMQTETGWSCRHIGRGNFFLPAH